MWLEFIRCSRQEFLHVECDDKEALDELKVEVTIEALIANRT